MDVEKGAVGSDNIVINDSNNNEITVINASQAIIVNGNVYQKKNDGISGRNEGNKIIEADEYERLLQASQQWEHLPYQVREILADWHEPDPLQIITQE